MGLSKHDRIANRLARKEKVPYNRGPGPDVKGNRRVIEVATSVGDLHSSLAQLRGYTKPRYLATSSDLLHQAKEISKGKKIGVMGPTGVIHKRAS